MKTAILQFLEKQINLEHIPGAVICVSFNGKVVLQEAVGYRSLYPSRTKMTVDTIFDLASLTKVVATTPTVLKLIEAGEIMLEDKITKFIPKFGSKGKEEITIRNLLTHTSGLPAHKPYYAKNLNADEIIQSICEEEVHSVGKKVVYSDLGFILLYRIIEQVTGEKYKDVVSKLIFEPLNMTETGFNLSFGKERIAPTEISPKTGQYKVGVVHDDNAESMGGISGHAGLFSTVGDLAKFASMIECGGIFEGKKVISRSSIDASRRNYTSFDEEYRGLGWLLKGPKYSPCGDLFSSSSFGHTGYTGTSIWFDPEINLHVILLTNRVHIQKQQEILNIRPKLHNLIRSHCV